MGLMVGGGSEPKPDTVIAITVTPAKSEFEVGERAECMFEIVKDRSRGGIPRQAA